MNIVPADVWTHVGAFLCGTDIVLVLSQTSWTLRQIFADIIETSIYQVRVDITGYTYGYMFDLYLVRDFQPVGKHWTFDDCDGSRTPWITLANRMLSSRTDQSRRVPTVDDRDGMECYYLADVDGVGLDPAEVLGGSEHYSRNFLRTMNVFNPLHRRRTKNTQEQQGLWMYWMGVVEFCDVQTAYTVAATSKSIRQLVRPLFYEKFSITLHHIDDDRVCISVSEREGRLYREWYSEEKDGHGPNDPFLVFLTSMASRVDIFSSQLDESSPTTEEAQNLLDNLYGVIPW